MQFHGEGWRLATPRRTAQFGLARIGNRNLKPSDRPLEAFHQAADDRPARDGMGISHSVGAAHLSLGRLDPAKPPGLQMVTRRHRRNQRDAKPGESALDRRAAGGDTKPGAGIDDPLARKKVAPVRARCIIGSPVRMNQYLIRQCRHRRAVTGDDGGCCDGDNPVVEQHLRAVIRIERMAVEDPQIHAVAVEVDGPGLKSDPFFKDTCKTTYLNAEGADKPLKSPVACEVLDLARSDLSPATASRPLRRRRLRGVAALRAVQFPLRLRLLDHAGLVPTHRLAPLPSWPWRESAPVDSIGSEMPEFLR